MDSEFNDTRQPGFHGPAGSLDLPEPTGVAREPETTAPPARTAAAPALPSESLAAAPERDTAESEVAVTLEASARVGGAPESSADSADSSAAAVGPGGVPGRAARSAESEAGPEVDVAIHNCGGVRPGVGSGCGFSERVAGIVERWNPNGMALVRAAGTVGAGQVALIGCGADVNMTLLRTELARFAPHVDLVVREPGCGDAGLPVPVALVVLEGGAPIGTGLLGELRGLIAEGTRIVFALDGIHAHAEWMEVRRQDCELLTAEKVAAEIVPVSARMAMVARANGDAALLDRSGVGLLHARLVAAAGAGAVADQGAIVRERVLGETRRRIAAELEKVRSGRDVAALREERATLLAVGDGGRGAAMSMVRNRVQLARVDLLHETGARVRALNAAVRVELERLPAGARGGFPQRLQCAVDKLTYEMDRAVRQRIAAVSAQLDQVVRAARSAALGEWAGRRDQDSPAESSGAGTGSGRGGELAVDSEFRGAVRRAARPPAVGPDPGPRRRGVEDHLVFAVGASAGTGLGRLVMAPMSLFEGLEYALLPVGLVLGVVAAAWVVRARGQLAERAHLRQWVADALVNVKAQLEQRVATALVETEERLIDRVVRDCAARVVETNRRVGELEADLRSAAQRRPGLTAACERDLAALEFA